MVKKYRVKVNGKEYLVEVEEVKEVKEVKETSKPSKVIEKEPQAKKIEQNVEKKPVLAQPDLSSITKAEEDSSIAGGKLIKSPMAGVVVKVLVNEGQKIKIGDPVLVFEAMKMENELRSEFSGTVVKVLVKKGDAIETGQDLIVVK